VDLEKITESIGYREHISFLVLRVHK